MTDDGKPDEPLKASPNELGITHMVLSSVICALLAAYIVFVQCQIHQLQDCCRNYSPAAKSVAAAKCECKK